MCSVCAWVCVQVQVDKWDITFGDVGCHLVAGAVTQSPDDVTFPARCGSLLPAAVVCCEMSKDCWTLRVRYCVLSRTAYITATEVRYCIPSRTFYITATEVRYCILSRTFYFTATDVRYCVQSCTFYITATEVRYCIPSRTFCITATEVR